MPVAEFAVALTSLKSAFDLTKAMADLRDANAFRAKSIELQGLILDSQGSAIEAREAYSSLLNQVSALEAEVARLKNWDAEKQNYELKKVGEGSVAYMLKPDKRGTEPPHWLCPNCYSKGQKGFLNGVKSLNMGGRGFSYKCGMCDAEQACYLSPQWQN
jgi:hypothetical protein